METPSATEAPPATPPTKPPRGKLANLVRNPKGVQPAHLKALRDDPERVNITKRTLMAELTKVLHKRDGALLADLAESIVKNAIKGNAACLSFLAERLAPVEKNGDDGGRVVWEGIKLEIVGGDSSKTSIALVRGSESHSGATPLNVSETPLEISQTPLNVSENQDSAQDGHATAWSRPEGPRQAEGLSESQVSTPRDVTLE